MPRGGSDSGEFDALHNLDLGSGLGPQVEAVAQKMIRAQTQAGAGAGRTRILLDLFEGHFRQR